MKKPFINRDSVSELGRRQIGSRNGFKSMEENKEDSKQMQGHSFFLGDDTNSRNNVAFFNLQTNKGI